MNAYIKSKNISFKNGELNYIGNIYSSDRFYTLINEYIDKNLTRKSRILSFVIKYLYKSSNYKHDTSLSNGRNI